MVGMQMSYLRAWTAQHLRTLRDNEEGQGLVEYALILALVSIAAVTMLTNIGDQVASVFESIWNELGGVAEEP